MTDLVVACVLRSGGRYTAEYAQKLFRSVSRHLDTPAPFVALSDMDIPGVRVIPLRYSWPGWWSKMEIFRHDVFIGKRVLYFDLDTIITGNLKDIQAVQDNTFLQDFYSPKAINSGVMMLNDRVPMWKDFYENAHGIMGEFGGDGDFLDRVVPEPNKWQTVLPGQVVSYKPNGARGPYLERKPKNARVVCFHGKPKPHEVEDWTREHWC